MATWTNTDMGWTGKIITVSEWNNYFGSDGNIMYLKDGWSTYSTSFIVLTYIPQNTVTVTTSFRIPVSWKDGLYATSVNVYTAQSNEATNDTRRIVYIVLNGGASFVNTYLSAATSFGQKPNYQVSTSRYLQVGDNVEFRFFQPNVAGSFISYGSIQKIGV